MDREGLKKVKLVFFLEGNLNYAWNKFDHLNRVLHKYLQKQAGTCKLRSSHKITADNSYFSCVGSG